EPITARFCGACGASLALENDANAGPFAERETVAESDAVQQSAEKEPEATVEREPGAGHAAGTAGGKEARPRPARTIERQTACPGAFSRALRVGRSPGVSRAVRRVFIAALALTALAILLGSGFLGWKLHDWNSSKTKEIAVAVNRPVRVIKPQQQAAGLM